MLIAAIVICVWLNAKLAVILLIVIPVMILAIGAIMVMCTKLFEVMQKRIDGLNNTLQENLVAIRVVKAFVRQSYERQKFKKANDELMQAGLNVGMRVIAIMPVMMLCMNAATVSVLYFGGKMVMGYEFDLGSLQAFINYIATILMSVMMVAMSLLQLSRAQACARRINEVLDTQPTVKNKELSDQANLPAPKGKVEFRDVSFKYDASGTGDDVLSHISFTVEPGKFVALVGGTGTGKSSLVNLIPRFYDVTGGAVLVDDVDVRDYPLEELRSRIGMVLQTNVLFTGTIRENLLWGKPDATEEEMIQAAKDAQAYDFIMSFPEGFDTYLDQGGVNVSGGQKQRLCIARAMLRKPAILILDDSTSAVDSTTEAAIRSSFAKNLKDTTVIIIAQRISSVQYADEILILDDDHIAGRGTHDELLASNPIYQEIYQSQQEGVGE
jgi:ATP-binding cassette subfamily B protein